MAAQVPANEAERLAALHSLGLVGTPPEERFDKITRLARRVFKVSVAVIDLVDDTRVWLKSVQGGERIEESPRETSYCQYAVMGDETCVIEDSRLDERLVGNPNVEAVRFYAGQPLKYLNHNVGVLCIYDPVPRTMEAWEIEALRDFGNLVERELEVGGLSERQAQLTQSHDELEVKALLDVLTRVWNRGAILEILARELEGSRQTGTSVGIALLDIDHFKAINDTHGHLAGDETLRRVAERLRMALGPGDSLGRYGGEEFLVILPNCGRVEVLEKANGLRKAVGGEPVCCDGQNLVVTLSAGTTVCEDGSVFTELLIRAADKALYRAKANGRDRVESSPAPCTTIRPPQPSMVPPKP